MKTQTKEEFKLAKESFKVGLEAGRLIQADIDIKLIEKERQKYSEWDDENAHSVCQDIIEEIEQVKKRLKIMEKK